MQALGMQLLLVFVGTLLWGVMLSPHKLMAAEPSESTASGSTVAGHVAFVNGQVMLNQPGKPNRPVQMGEPVFVGDRIQTQAKSQLHLRMVDNAFLAMRPSSQLVISAYQYDKDQPQASRIRIDLEQGTSRAVSGKGGRCSQNPGVCSTRGRHSESHWPRLSNLSTRPLCITFVSRTYSRHTQRFY